ncbi:NUDIX domain-containing protein [Streptomyces sp. NPDC052309]|uniref:NUDIX domain-containing protein n=1 Tax=Streptomyces sp. NPDC052309 TaxID=3155421 RepID=UPI003431BE22
MGWDVRARRGQRRVLHLPGGGTGGQAPEEAALRELDEETGVVAAEVRALAVMVLCPRPSPHGRTSSSSGMRTLAPCACAPL